MGRRKRINIPRSNRMNESKKQKLQEELEMCEEYGQEEEIFQHYALDEEMDDEYAQEEEDGVAPTHTFIDGIKIPTHCLADPRNGDGMVLELDENEIAYLANFDDDYSDLHEIVGVVWQKQNVDKQITVGHTNKHPQQWASNANYLGLKFVANPTMRTKACRCVITAIQDDLIMNVKKALSFKIYMRTYLLAGKVKGMVRRITTCIHKGEAIDDTYALVPFHRYNERKCFNAMDYLPNANQTGLIRYLRGEGWNINII